MKNAKTQYREAIESLAKVEPLIAKGFPDPDLFPDADLVPVPTAKELDARATGKSRGPRNGKGHKAHTTRQNGRRISAVLYKQKDRREGHRPDVVDLLQREGQADQRVEPQHERAGRLEALEEAPRRDRSRKASGAGHRANHLRGYGRDAQERLHRQRPQEHELRQAGDRAFGKLLRRGKANEITSDRVTAYVAMRQKEKAANATINGELAALCRMFTLAIRAGKAGARPYIARLAENNARKGFFDAEQFQAVLKQLPRRDPAGGDHRLRDGLAGS